MSVGLIVLAVGVASGLLVMAVSISRRNELEPFPDREKRWLVEKLGGGRIAAFARRRLSRESAGGLLLTVGFLLVITLATLVGWIFDMVDAGTGFAVFDESVAEYGASQADALSADLQLIFTRLGGTMVIAIVTAATAIWGWWRYGDPQVAFFMVTVVIGQALLNSGLKSLVARDRPDINPLAPFSGSSFPSGHSAAAGATYAAAALVLTLHSERVTRSVAAGVAAFIAIGVAATRALLSVHWLTDVIAGLAVGFGWFVVCAVVFGGRLMKFGEPRDEIARQAEGAPS